MSAVAGEWALTADIVHAHGLMDSTVIASIPTSLRFRRNCWPPSGAGLEFAPETFSVTKALERAFATVSRMSARDQNSYARWMLAELESDARWAKAFRRSASKLAQLADEALVEHRSGRTRRVNSSR